MDEKTFVDSIDAAFPYDDEERGRRLVRIGCELSPEAAFTVLFELTFPPRGAHAPASTRRQLVDDLDHRLDHPAKAIVLPVARRLIDEEVLEVAAVIDSMERLASVCRCWSALNLLYLACDDRDGELEPVYHRIETEWLHR